MAYLMKMQTSMEGPRHSFVRGGEFEFERGEAISLTRAGFARAVDPVQAAEIVDVLTAEGVIVEPVTEPVAEPVAEPVPVSEPVVEPVPEPTPVAEPQPEPAPVVEPQPEPAPAKRVRAARA